MYTDLELLSEFFDGQPQAIVWLKPVWSDNGEAIIDFEYAYCNEEGLRFLNLSPEQQQGLKISNSPTLTPELRQKILAEMAEVFQSGKRSESSLYVPPLGKYAQVLRSKLRGGVLTVVQDVTQENLMIRQLEDQKRQLEEEKAFSNSVLDASLSAIYTCKAIRDQQGHVADLQYLQVNRVFMRMMGLSAEQVIGKSMLTLFPEVKEQGAFDRLVLVLETGEPLQEERFYSGEGLHRWYSYAIVKKGSDEVVTTFTDITEQKRAELEKDRQKTLLDQVLRYSPSGISVTEIVRDNEGKVIDGRTVVVNDVAEQYLGISKEKLLASTVRELDPALFDSPLFGMALGALQTGEPFHLQYFFEPAGRWLDLSVSKMDDDHLINVFMDITTTKETQLQLEKSLEELRRSNANLEEFAHAASHDLKEPIRKIHTFSDRLKHSLAPRMTDPEVRMFERMEHATERMRLLVDDLLEYSHVSVRPRQKESVNLAEKLQAVLTDLEVLLEEKKAVVRIGELPVVMGYRRQLQQLFQNLVGNALKYSKADGVPEITISARTVTGSEVSVPLLTEDLTKSFHLIEVRDNGIGFEQQYAERIFHMFQRLHGKSEYSGTGVGLSIVRKVVENHGGYVWAEGQPGMGAAFYVLLPAEGEEVADSEP